MSIFRQPTNSTVSSRILGYRAQSSLYGRPIAVAYGRVRLAPNVIWTGGWTANPVSGGKGNKGKGGTQYDYITNVLMALCQGPVSGVFSIWRDKDKFNLADSTETYVIPSGGGTYTTQHGGTGSPEWWVINIGVLRQDSTSYTANDYGSPGTVSGSATVWTPMILAGVSYTGGVSPSGIATGTYILTNDSSGYAKYTFGPGDAGKTVKITYSYQINDYSTQGSPMTHLNLNLFSGLLGQLPWSYLLENAAFASQALGYSELAYIASPTLDLGSSGVIPSLNFEVQGRFGPPDVATASGPDQCDCNPADIIRDLLTNPLDGALGWTTAVSSAPMAQPVPVMFGGTCTVTTTGGAELVAVSPSTFANLVVGQQITIGLTGIGTAGSTTVASIIDSTHITVANPVYSQPTQQLTWTAEMLQAGTVSQLLGGSAWLPAVTAANGVGAASQLYQYCAANGLFVSCLNDQQRAAREIISELLEIANSDAFWSEGLLKFGCYGDTTTVGTSGAQPGVGPVTYSPQTQPVYDISDASLICGPGEEPVKMTRPDVRDVKNEVTVEWTNRSADYATNTLQPAQDASMVALYGRRPESVRSYHGITRQDVAVAVQSTVLKRLVYIDGSGSVQVTLPPHFALLDPMDLITLTDLYLGWNKQPFRITRIEEGDKLALKLTLEAFPWSVSGPTLNPSQGHTPTLAGYYAAPGHVNNPQFVQMPPELTQGNPYVLGIALSGGQNWGGAAAYVSTDGGNSYDPISMATGAATMGTLTAALAVSADPDTATNALQVNLTESFGQLDSYTQAQADADIPLIAVDQELLAYETADLLGTYEYGLTYLRRGVYATINAAHAIGAPFCVVDDSLFQYQFPASAIGKTLHFKFCSVNLAGQRQEDISQVEDYTVTITAPPAAPTFAVGVSELDSTVAEVAALSFGTGVNPNNFQIASGTFRFYYSDPGGFNYVLASSLGVSDTSMTLDAPGTGEPAVSALAGQYAQIGEEIVLCGTPSGNTVPITRAQLGSTAATAAASASVFHVQLQNTTVPFQAGFFASADAATWALEQALPNMLLVAVQGYFTNAYGNSAVGTVSLTGGSSHGLLLTAPAAGASQVVTHNVTNSSGSPSTYAIPTGNVLIVLYLTGTGSTCTLTLPPEASDEGDTVTVQFAAGSTQLAYIDPGSGDTIDGSSTPKTLDPTGVAGPTAWMGVAS